jgi:predicted phosphodiesterase
VKLLVSADLHFGHAVSEPLAEELVERINASEDADALLLVGDTATADGDKLERALARFTFRGPKLFVAGNHELWSRDADTAVLWSQTLPRRVTNAGWQWLQGAPWVGGDVAIVGSIGWYDYSFAVAELGIARRFYEAKVSPGVAGRLSQFQHLIQGEEPPTATDIVARWNDGKFVRLGRSDEAFLNECLDQLRAHLSLVQNEGAKRILCAVHHVPFEELLPPRRGAQWDFARAYLGSGRIGGLIEEFDGVTHVLCGHSHFPVETTLGRVRAINIGSGYRHKRLIELEL